MADANLHCKTCGETTEHMHLGGRICVCSVCGENNVAKNWKQIKAEVEARKRANQEAVAKRNGAVDETMAPPAPDTRKRLSEAEVAEIRKRYVELTAGNKSRWDAWVTLSADFGVSETCIRSKVGDLDKTNPASAEPIAAQTETPATDTETNETTKETDMRKRLTDQEKADIGRRYQEGATVTTLAADFHVSGQCIRTVVKKLKAQRGRKPGRVAKAARPEAGAPQAGGLKAALQAMVEAAVEARLAEFQATIKDEIVKSVSVSAEDLDAKVEAALARALK